VFGPALIVGGAALALVALAGGGQGSGGAAGEWPDAAGLDELAAVMDAAHVPGDWQVFFAVIAYRESKWHSDVGLGPNNAPGRPPWLRDSKAPVRLREAEAAAACRGYERNRAKYFANAPWSAARYCWGSGGFFGLLPAFGVISGFRATPELIAQIDPWGVADPVVGFVMAVGFARGLMGWKQFRAGGSTWLALATGWGEPGKMGDRAAQDKRRKKFAEALDLLGVPRSFMDRQVSPLEILRAGHLLQMLEQSDQLILEAA